MTDGVFNTEANPQPTATPDLALLEKRLADKDAFIAQLQDENKGLRELSQNAKTVQEILEEARKTAAPAPVAPEPAKPAETDKPQGIDPDELVERVEKALAAKTAEQTATANAKAVNDFLIEKFGTVEAASKAVADRAAELNLDVKDLLETAKKSPNAFYELVKVEGPKQMQAPRSEVRTEALGQHSSGPKEGTNAWYEQMRQQIGNEKFYSPKIQNQRFKDAQRLGSAFYN